MPEQFDALLVLSFGGPERPEDVMPFLENVTRGRGVPLERLLEVAENYARLGGVSPINEQTRALIAALRTELDQHGLKLPIYWGNRNWHPFTEETMRRMSADGVRRALVFVTSAYGSYSACRQYLEDLDNARAAVTGETPSFERLPHYCLLPGFIEPLIERVSDAFAHVPEERRAGTKLLFTAHSIPVAMSQTSNYFGQLTDVARLVAQGVRHPEYRLVFQSRSGPPQQPWLEPDVRDALREEARAGVKDVVVAPIGFISDHMEVKFDLDTQARELAGSLGLNMVRAATVGTHPKFVAMIRELIEERLSGAREACPWPCTETCCPSPQRA
ncbi:MAG: ferrochelatase, partial [Terracidiphilus sp.]